jgi:hypothetical protein
MIECLKAEGGYLCSTDEREKLRQYMWPDGSHLNRDIVARPATFIAEQAIVPASLIMFYGNWGLAKSKSMTVQSPSIVVTTSYR